MEVLIAQKSYRILLRFSPNSKGVFSWLDMRHVLLLEGQATSTKPAFSNMDGNSMKLEPGGRRPLLGAGG